MPSTYKTVALAGATGNLGPTLITALHNAGYQLTILIRPTSQGARHVPDNVKVIPVDYTSTAALTTALQGQDVFLSVIPDHAAQQVFIDAAIAAGVKRFLPSEYGHDVLGDERIADLPVFRHGKRVIQAYLKERQDKLTWTSVVTGLFLDWCLDFGFSVDLKGTSRLVDGGHKKTSQTLLTDIGKAVVGVLEHPEETKNRAVYVQSAVVSQDQLLQIAKKVKPDFSPAVKQVTITQLERDAKTKIERGEDVEANMMEFVFGAAFGEPYHAEWSGQNDDRLFGIKELSTEQLEEVVARYLPR